MINKDQTKRLNDLRAVMKNHGLAAYLVPHADEFQNEYTPPCAQRLKWISGFDGTAGLAVVGLDQAAIFVDGRYTLQVQDQASSKFWQHLHLVNDPVELWLQREFKSGDRVGFDPRLHTTGGLSRLETVLQNHGMELVLIEDNLIDEIWQDQPPAPQGKINLYAQLYNGEASINKRCRVAKNLRRENMDAVIISSPDNLAWLLNIRGQDLEFTPLVLAYGILYANATATLFVAGEKVNSDIKTSLESDGISVQELDQFEQALTDLKEKNVRLERSTASVYMRDILQKSGAKINMGNDPISLPKAIKNPVEQDGMREAHVQDGVALARFFHWFRTVAPGQQTEWTVAQKLDAFRACGDLYQSPSFATISATGANAAIVHYGLKKEQAATLQNDQLYLVDSGGQYLNGTTDVTRVVAMGTPTAEMIRRYTQVLKGHIAVSAARFPPGTTGAQIDSLARQFLWADGLDYDHGTGHGVGCFLSVHEGPQSLSKRATNVALKPGMVLSIEPGYYKAHAFGIRIENLALVKKMSNPSSDCTLGFVPLTLAAYERRLIDVALLSKDECAWLDAYHARVYEILAPLLDADEANALMQETNPLTTP